METIENNNIQHKLKPRRSRACFTHHQLLELERRFSIQRYLQSLNSKYVLTYVRQSKLLTDRNSKQKPFFGHLLFQTGIIEELGLPLAC